MKTNSELNFFVMFNAKIDFLDKNILSKLNPLNKKSVFGSLSFLGLRSISTLMTICHILGAIGKLCL